MQQQTFDTCTAFVIVPAFALPHYMYVRSPALHIALHYALQLHYLLLLLCNCYCVPQNCIPARAMRCYLGGYGMCVASITLRPDYCVFALHIACNGPTQAKHNITLIHCCTFAHFAILHAVLQRKRIVVVFAKRPVASKINNPADCVVGFAVPLLFYYSIVARIRL